MKDPDYIVRLGLCDGLAGLVDAVGEYVAALKARDCGKMDLGSVTRKLDLVIEAYAALESEYKAADSAVDSFTAGIW